MMFLFYLMFVLYMMIKMPNLNANSSLSDALSASRHKEARM